MVFVYEITNYVQDIQDEFEEGGILYTIYTIKHTGRILEGHSVVMKEKVKHSFYRPGSDPEGFRKLRCPDFMTTAQDGGKVVSLTHRPPLPQEIHLVLISL
jgi:hypothetical protein